MLTITQAVLAYWLVSAGKPVDQYCDVQVLCVDGVCAVVDIQEPCMVMCSDKPLSLYIDGREYKHVLACDDLLGPDL